MIVMYMRHFHIDSTFDRTTNTNLRITFFIAQTKISVKKLSTIVPVQKHEFRKQSRIIIHEYTYAHVKLIRLLVAGSSTTVMTDLAYEDKKRFALKAKGIVSKTPLRGGLKHPAKDWFANTQGYPSGDPNNLLSV